MQTIVTATAPAELLALIPRLIGPIRPGSIVVVAFDGTRSCGTMRIDLPDPVDLSTADALAHALVGGLCRVGSATAVVAIAYPAAGSEDAATAASVAMHRFMTLAERQGFAIRQSLWQSDAGWGSYLDANEGGESLGEVRAAAARVPALPWTADALAHAEALEPSAEFREAVAAVLTAFDEPHADSPKRTTADPIAFAEALLERDPGELLPAELALLVVSLRQKTVRDAVLMQLAFGAEFGRAVLDAGLRVERTGAWPQEGTGRGERLGAAADALVEASDRLLGQSGRPDPERLIRAVGLVSLAAASVDDDQAVEVQTMRAWLLWAMGRCSTAQSLLERVQRVAPGHTLSRLLTVAIGHGALPEWLFGRG